MNKSLDRYFQKRIMETFENECQYCHGQAVTAHHIIHRHNPKLRHDARNGIPLCLKCHAYAHREPLIFDTWVSDWLQQIHGITYEELKRLGN